MNRDDGTSALTVMDDAQAVALFLHERASRSRHTLHAYAANLRRLIGWCRNRHLGPLSDLTRNDLLAWRDHLRMVRVSADSRQCAAAAGELTQARVLAVAASLYQYWFDTGYLIANPASGLVTGTQARTGFAPQHFLPSATLATCDAWMAAMPAGIDNDNLMLLRRRGIWVLYRYGDVRLAELAWTIDTNLPRIKVNDGGQWALYVHGKGGKPRAIPLPAVAVAPLAAYRLVRGLPQEPAVHDRGRAHSAAASTHTPADAGSAARSSGCIVGPDSGALDRIVAGWSCASHGSRGIPAIPSSRPLPAPRRHCPPCADAPISERHPAPPACRYSNSGRPSCARFAASRSASAPLPPCFCHVRIPAPPACACTPAHHASGATFPVAAVAVQQSTSVRPWRFPPAHAIGQIGVKNYSITYLANSHKLGIVRATPM